MKVRYYETLPSTNTYLKENYKNFESGIVIVTNKQTDGRGRFTRKWISDNDLTFSIMFKGVDYNHGLVAPLAIIEALENFKISAKIKWPNDIYIDGKKLAGILIESIYEANDLKCVIVGIGINLEKKDDDLNACYVNINKNDLLSNILSAYENLLKINEDTLLKLYYEYGLLNNRLVLYKEHNYKIKGYTKNLELILTNNKSELLVNASEIDIKKNIIL